MSGAEVRRLAQEIARVSQRVRGLEATPQAGHTSLESGQSIKSYDRDGNLRLRIGGQGDGTQTIKHVDGPPPPAPSAPVVEVDGPVLRVRWDGEFADGAVMPEDFARVDVHVEGPSTARVAGTLTTRAGSEVVLKATEQGEHTVTLIAVSASETPSDPSEPVAVEVKFASFTGAIESVVGSSNGVNRITYSPRPPGPEDEGKLGDTWWVNEEREHADTGELYIAITEQWQYTPDGWTQVALAHEVIASVDLGTATVGFLHGQRIVAGSIDTELLAATAIDGMIITGAVFQTAGLDPRGMFDQDGIRFTDDEGAVTVQLTPHPEITQGDFLGLRGADGESIFNVSEDGTMSSRGINVENDPVVAGKRLLGDTIDWESPAALTPTGVLDALPRGLVAFTQLAIGVRTVDNEEQELAELSFQADAGRSYRVTVEPFTAYAINNGRAALDSNPIVEMYIRTTQDGTRPSLTSTIWQAQLQRGGTGNDFSAHSMGGSWVWDVNAGTGYEVKMLLTLRSIGRAQLYNWSVVNDLRVYVEDVGMRVQDTGVIRTGTNASPVAPPPVKKNYTKTYTANAGRTFWTSGGYRTDNTQYAYQGNGPYGGSQRSVLTFPSMTGDLSGAEITSVRAYLYFEHWYYSGGGTARIHLHGAPSLPTSLPSMTLVATSTGWPKPGGRWVTIPTQYWNGLRTGTYRGIGLGVASGTRTEYGYARVNATKLEVKYRK